MKNKYSRCLKVAGTTGIVLAMTSGASQAGVTEVPVNQILNNFGGVGFVSFNPIGTDFFPDFDSSNFDAVARNCGLNLLAYNNFGAMTWSENAVALGSTVDNSVTFGNPGFPNSPSLGENTYYGYEYVFGGDTFYGFAHFSGVVPGTDFSKDFLFNGYAFEDSAGTGITVGAIPEPSSGALGLAVAASLLALGQRRRRA